MFALSTDAIESLLFVIIMNQLISLAITGHISYSKDILK
jgi:hypothetical protein